MAIFSINDGSLSRYLNENRHDVKRTLKMTSDNIKKAGFTDFDEKTLKKSYKLNNNIAKDITKNSSTDDIKKAAKIVTDQKRNDRAVEERNKPLNATPNQIAARKYLNQQMAKDIVGKVHGAELKRRGLDPKTGEKLKEAAEYILSVLDEMEYSKKSEKEIINEGIIDFLKDADLFDKVNKDKSLVYKNSKLHSYITKIHNEILKILKSKKIKNAKYYISNYKTSSLYHINPYEKEYPIKYTDTIGYTTNGSDIKNGLKSYINNYITNNILDSGDKIKFYIYESTNESNVEFHKINTSNDIYFEFTLYINKNNFKKYIG